LIYKYNTRSKLSIPKTNSFQDPVVYDGFAEKTLKTELSILTGIPHQKFRVCDPKRGAIYNGDLRVTDVDPVSKQTGVITNKLYFFPTGVLSLTHPDIQSLPQKKRIEKYSFGNTFDY